MTDLLSRRDMLRLSAAGVIGTSFSTWLPILAAHSAETRTATKRCILLWLAGGASQLETFDPKPGATTGGPFRAIKTSVPGVQISELMPKMAARMHHSCIIRSLNTRNADHGSAERVSRPPGTWKTSSPPGLSTRASSPT